MNTTGKKFGGRTKGTPNKLSNKIKDKLSSIISEAIDSLDLECMSKDQIGLIGAICFFGWGLGAAIIPAYADIYGRRGP